MLNKATRLDHDHILLLLEGYNESFLIESDIQTYGYESILDVYYTKQSVLVVKEKQKLELVGETLDGVDELRLLYPIELIAGRAELIQDIKGHKLTFQLAKSNQEFTDVEKMNRVKSRTGLYRLYQLLRSIDEFTYFNMSLNEFMSKRVKSMLKNKTSVCFYNNGFKSTATTKYRNDEYDLIVNVATHKNERKKGYATQLIRYILSQKKKYYLFYEENESFYLNNGFENVCEYTYVYMEENND